MNAQITLETVNPKMATDWLANKWDEQRPIRMNHVARLATEIRSGKFRLSWDAVALIKGRLANGQHRLSAVVESGKSAQFIVMRTSDEDLFKIGDSGTSRTVADVLRGSEYPTIVAAAARMIMSYDGKWLCASGSNYKYDPNQKKSPITRSSILEYIEKNHAALVEQTLFVRTLYTKSRIIGATVGTGFLHIASRKNKDLAREFITNVYTGEVLDASKDFRDRMIRQMGTKSRLRQEYVLALLIKAWKSFKNSTRPGSLRMAEGESFPEI